MRYIQQNTAPLLSMALLKSTVRMGHAYQMTRGTAFHRIVPLESYQTS